MTCGLVHASYSLPEWQAVKLTFLCTLTYLSYYHSCTTKGSQACGQILQKPCYTVYKVVLTTLTKNRFVGGGFVGLHSLARN